jgi:UDP-N-acetylglucosamine--N-acetylmuramyl-(pentapeptide) pyrophosphoryl-undecaprenol N-acetylglucosamine transferase
LALMKKAAVLIPSPNVADNHQYKNAKTLADASAAFLIEEPTLRSGALSDAVWKLLSDGALKRSLEENISSFAQADANRLIWKEILELTK